MTKTTPTKTPPHLWPLKGVAREIGASRDTIARNPTAFFPMIKLGHKRFVASAAYAAWMAEYLSHAGGRTARAV
jgi:hypothetical protein